MKGKLKLLVLPLLLIAMVFGFGLTKVSADDVATETLSNAKVKVYFFRGEGCSHCAEAEQWFSSIQETEGQYFEIVDYEVWYDENNKELMTKIAKFFNEEDQVTGVPYIIVGDQTFKGFNESYEIQILEEIHSEYQMNVEDRFDVMERMNAVKPWLTYVVLGLAFALIVFIIVARHFSPAAEEVNYEDDNQYQDEADEEKKVEDKLEKALAGTPKPTKTTKTSSAKKTTDTKKAKTTTTKKTTKTTKKTTTKSKK